MHLDQNQEFMGAAVVAQLVEWLLPSPENFGSNPVNFIVLTKIRKKQGMSLLKNYSFKISITFLACRHQNFGLKFLVFGSKFWII